MGSLCGPAIAPEDHVAVGCGRRGLKSRRTDGLAETAIGRTRESSTDPSCRACSPHRRGSDVSRVDTTVVLMRVSGAGIRFMRR